MYRAIIMLCGLCIANSAVAETLTPEARHLYEMAGHGPRFESVSALKPSIVPTSDNRSFFVIWTPEKNTKVTKWIVSLHGSNGFATEDFAVWSPYITNRDVGYIGLQWWLGEQDLYYTPHEIYRELDRLMTNMQITPGTAMLEGFSRGSANIYAVAAIDHTHGQQYFSLFIASSGGVSLDYPPTHRIEAGEYGELPFKGSQWITACGGKDEHPMRDGCPAMRNAVEWLKKQGATIVMQLEDEHEGHGAFHRNPALATQAVDYFLK